jgi:hypothetical protein
MAKQLAHELPSLAKQTAWVPKNDADRAAARQQLHRILESPMFKNSRRCSLLLRFAIERLLNGQNDIKERTIGIEVFGRSADYDTNEDPVVRNTAVEVRKRLAQFYNDPAHAADMRIDLPAGAYLPEFHVSGESVNTENSLRVPRRRLGALLLSAVIAVLAGAIFWSKSSTSSSALDRFWNPIWNSSETALICLGGFNSAVGSGSGQSTTQDSISGSTGNATQLSSTTKFLAYPDTMGLTKIVGLMTAKKKLFRIRIQNELNLEDFKTGPVILIGGGNDQWSSRVMSSLRFSFQTDGNVNWIRDSLNPAERKRSAERDTSARNVKCYALISRVSDPAIGGNITCITGLLAPATAAAAEFVSEASSLEKIGTNAPKSWYRMNMQIRIAMQLYENSFSTPYIEATHFW